MPKKQTFDGYEFDSTCDFTVGDILTGKVRKGEKTLSVSPGESESPLPVGTLLPDPNEWKDIKAEVVSVSDDGKITVIKRLEGGENIPLHATSEIVLQTDDQGKQYPYSFNVDEYELETVE